MKTKYRVTVHGRAFDIEVDESDSGPRARIVADAGAPRHALDPRQGPLAALVTETAAITVSVDRSIEENVYEVLLPGGRPLRCEVEDERTRLVRGRVVAKRGGEAGPKTVRAVMPGIVAKVLVTVGAVVGPKDALLVVEAMKMQNEIRAESAGKIAKLHVKPGQSVAAGAPLLDLAAPDAPS